MRQRYEVVPGKTVTMGDMEASASSDGSILIVTIVDTPHTLSPHQASRLHEVLDDVLEWAGGPEKDD